MTFRLVIFDLDGTLVETAPEITDAVNDTLRAYGWPVVDEAQVARWIGHGTGALLVQAIARASGRAPDLVRASPELAAIGAVYDRFYAERCGTRSRLYPGVRDALRTLRDAGTKLALVTNKEARYTDRVLEAHALRGAFDRVVCGDTTATRKPDPSGVLACLREFEVEPAHAVFVGDSSIDADTARRAGIESWLLPWGYNGGQPVANCGADRVIADLSPLLLRQRKETA